MSTIRSGRAVSYEKFNYFTSVTKKIHAVLDSSISKLYPQGMGVYARKDDLLQQAEYYPEAAKEVALEWQKHRCSVLKPTFLPRQSGLVILSSRKSIPTMKKA